MNLDLSVVADEAELAEFVHEMADTGSGDADHLRQYFLTDWLRDTFLAENQRAAKASAQVAARSN